MISVPWGQMSRKTREDLRWASNKGQRDRRRRGSVQTSNGVQRPFLDKVSGASEVSDGLKHYYSIDIAVRFVFPWVLPNRWIVNKWQVKKIKVIILLNKFEKHCDKNRGALTSEPWCAGNVHCQGHSDDNRQRSTMCLTLEACFSQRARVPWSLCWELLRSVYSYT